VLTRSTVPRKVGKNANETRTEFPVSDSGNATNNAVSPSSPRESTADQGTPWIRFDIREPVVTIQILPNLKEVPAIPWLPTEGVKQPSSQTNPAGSAVVQPKLGTEAK
jgi:hypothetical protein